MRTTPEVNESETVKNLISQEIQFYTHRLAEALRMERDWRAEQKMVRVEQLKELTPIFHSHSTKFIDRRQEILQKRCNGALEKLSIQLQWLDKEMQYLRRYIQRAMADFASIKSSTITGKQAAKYACNRLVEIHRFGDKWQRVEMSYYQYFEKGMKTSFGGTTIQHTPHLHQKNTDTATRDDQTRTTTHGRLVQ